MNYSYNVETTLGEAFESELIDFGENKCRLCGITDVKNVNIFTTTNCEKLLVKIFTVYPIIIYKDDPLPKFICRKCIYNVGFMFNDIQKVLRNQLQWLEDARGSQPDHAYFKLLELLEQSHEETRNFIKSSMQQDLDKTILQRSLVMSELNMDRIKFKKNAIVASKINQEFHKKPTPTPPLKQTPININSFSFDYEEPKTQVLSKPDEEDESNGFSLASDFEKSNEGSLTTNPSQTANPSDEDEEADDIDDDLVLTQLKDLPPEPVQCSRCPLTFDNPSLLSTHQIEHLQLSLPKIFEKRLLPRDLRKGRLITVEDRKCIRCLNCWRVFDDNKGILQHWSQGECDYYCQVCGMEFAQAPKQLREHVTTEHGISYRALKVQREVLVKKSEEQPKKQSLPLTLQAEATKQPIKPQSPLLGPASVKAAANRSALDDVKRSVAAKVAAMTAMPTTTPAPTPTPTPNTSKAYLTKPYNPNQCPICDQMFQNGKARNSHMRKHKPPNSNPDIFGHTAKYKKHYSSLYGVPGQFKPAPAPPPPMPQHANILQAALMSNNPYTSSSSSSLHSTRPLTMPPLQPIQRVGVRTKFVPTREDSLKAQEAPGTSIKVRSINEMQMDFPSSPLLDPAMCVEAAMDTDVKSEPLHEEASSNSAYDYINVPATVSKPSTPSPPAPLTNEHIKPEPMDHDDEPENNYTGSEFTAHHAGDAGNDEDEEDDGDEAASSLATCEFCSKCFLYEDDLRLHKAQVHRAAI